MSACSSEGGHLFRWSTKQCDCGNVLLNNVVSGMIRFLKHDAPTPSQWDEYMSGYGNRAGYILESVIGKLPQKQVAITMFEDDVLLLRGLLSSDKRTYVSARNEVMVGMIERAVRALEEAKAINEKKQE